MDREAVAKQMKQLKLKGKAAHKAGKREVAISFKHGAARLSRQLKATAPRGAKKAEEAKA